jgi:PAS domain S-box-containing protein
MLNQITSLTYLDESLDPNIALSASYDTPLVLLSLFIAFLASYAALGIVAKMQSSTSLMGRNLWLVFGAISLGNGIFAMHFLGMVAHILPIQVSYDFYLTLFSGFLAVLASALGLHFAALKKRSKLNHISGGIAVGVGISGMHYMGMMSMLLNAKMVFDPLLFILSILAAILLAITALHAKHLTNNWMQLQSGKILERVTSPLIMSLAISGMHYIAMTATFFFPLESGISEVATGMDSNELSMAVSGLVLLTIISSLLVTKLNQKDLATFDDNHEIDFNWKQELRKTYINIISPLVALIICTVIVAIYLHTTSSQQDANLKAQSNMHLAATHTQNDFENIFTHLHLLALGKPLHKMVNQPSDTNRKLLEEQFLNFSQTTSLYEQIRYIASNGKEIVRVDSYKDTSKEVQGLQLQNKSDRSYFKYAMELAKGKIYISPLDLNMEQGVVERPFKPMIRFGTPIFDDTGEKTGVLILNYRADVILAGIRKVFSKSRYKVYFLNSTGYFILGPTPQQEWGFMFGRNDTFGNMYPAAWSTVSNKNQGQFKTEHGIFTFLKIEGSTFPKLGSTKVGNGRAWKIVIHDNPHQLSFRDAGDHPVAIAVVVGALMVTGLISWFLSLSMVSKMRAEKISAELLRQVNFQKFALDEHAIVSSTDVKGNINYMNEKFCQVSGFSREELMGKSHRLVKSREHSPEFYKKLWKTISKGKTWHGEVKNHKKGGGDYWVRATIVPFMNEKNKPFKYVSIRTDITKAKEMEFALAQALETAREATKAKSDFLANMSHEIRTPMNAIIGMGHLALNTDLNRKQRDYVSKIHTAANSLLGLINDILDFSKIEAGKMDVESIPFRLDNVMSNFTTLISGKAREKGLEILIAIGEDVPNGLLGDPLRLGQILTNLANNAVKFTEQGEIIVRVDLLKSNYPSINLQFSVQDSGIGMSKKQMGRLFKSFSQADTTTTRKYGGTGLGLSISKKLTELMGGNIRVESQTGQGSTFIFNAILQATQEIETPLQTTKFNIDETRVLVVDDSDFSREILMQMSQRLSFDVAVAASGKEALRLIKESDKTSEPFKLIFMDWKMPEMDGVEATRLIKEDLSLTATPSVVMVTAYDRDEMQRKIHNVKVDGFLTKPVTSSSLLDAALTALNIQNSQRSEESSNSQDWGLNAVKNIQGASILLIEDNIVNQQIAKELLEEGKLVISIANNGRQGVDKLLAQKPETYDCVLMDVQMPEMDGYEATRAIRKNGQFKDLPILAMTANAMSGDREKCLDAGMNDHIAKPIDPSQLFTTLAKWIKPGKRELPLVVEGEKDDSDNKEDSIPDIAGIDVQAGLARVGGKPKAYIKLLNLFISNQKNVITDIRQALINDDKEKAVRSAHTLKGTAGSIGANSLYLKASDLEEKLLGGSITTDAEQLNLAEQELGQTIAVIQEGLTKKKPKIAASKTSQENISIPKLKELLTMISQFNSEAEDFLEDILDSLGENAISGSLEEVKIQLAKYDFEAATEKLKPIIENLDENNP